MKKSECLNTIFQVAELYKVNFANSNLLFITREKTSKASTIETVFLENNFLHLIGVKTEMSPARFYNNCLNRRLSPDDFQIKNDGTTEQKLRILPVLLNSKHLGANIMGTYIGGRPYLVTDKLVGNIRGAMGFVENNGYYHPNTVLEGDIRDNIKRDKQARILAVYKKMVSDEEYVDLIYRAKGVSAELADSLLSEVVDK